MNVTNILVIVSLLISVSQGNSHRFNTLFSIDSDPNTNDESTDLIREAMKATMNETDEFAMLEPTACSLYDQTFLLMCAAPLSAFMRPLGRYPTPPHPPLHQIELVCAAYDKFSECVGEQMNMECMHSVADKIMMVFDAVCDTKIRSNITSQSACLLSMTADLSMTECHQNKTAKMTSSEETETCHVMQSFADCMVEHKYLHSCQEAVDLEVDIMNMIEPDCGITAEEPEIDLSKPQCTEKGVCTCEPGHTYNIDEQTCDDVDECSQSVNQCSQRCINTDGSFECECHEQFYSLANDSLTCVRTDDDPLWIFFAHGQSIWNISADGKDFQLQRAGLQKTAMIDLDMKERRIFYADIGANKIETMLLDGVFPKTIQFYEVEGTEGIAVDWIGRNLYTLRKQDIWVQKLDGRFRMRLYEGVLNLPRALAVNPLDGYMYVTDWGSDAFIGRAAMDGTGFERIVSEGVVWPNALAIDYYSDTLYWADAFLDTIEMSKCDGSNRRTLVSEAASVPHVFGLAIADDYIYWTDWTFRGILRADKRTGSNVTVLAQTALLPYSVKVFHRAMQPDGNDPCVDMNCSQLCLLSPLNVTDPYDNVTTSAACGCAEGFILMADGKTCKSQCADSQILCGGSDPRCISKVYWCDGQGQCWDHEDERDCPRRVCLPGQFQCHNGTQCLSSGDVCDGTPHCEDSSDEKYC